MTPTGPEYRMHHYSEATDRLADAIFGAARKRISEEPVPLDSTATEAQLEAAAGPTITPAGIGGHEALRIFEDILHPNCLSVDYTKYLSFVPAAPTEAAVLFDVLVGAASIYGGSWLEGAGAVHAAASDRTATASARRASTIMASEIDDAAVDFPFAVARGLWPPRPAVLGRHGLAVGPDAGLGRRLPACPVAVVAVLRRLGHGALAMA